MIRGRPVEPRASLMAKSMASPPPVPNMVQERSPGVISASLAPSSALACEQSRKFPLSSWSMAAWAAATTRGFLRPTLNEPAEVKQSRNLAPSTSHTQAPDRLASIMSSPAAFKDVRDAPLLAEFQEVNRAAIDSLNAYRAFLETDLLPRSQGEFRIGAETYRKKLLYDEMVDIPLDRLLEIGRENLRRN